VDIHRNKGENKTEMTLQYNNENFTITSDMLAEIVAERDVLYRNIDSPITLDT
jgi:hypothetical protein